MSYKSTKISTLFALGLIASANAQTNDATTPLHLMQPDYPTPYIIPQKENIKAVLDRVYNFLDKNSASKIVNAATKADIKDYKKTKKILFSNRELSG
jgi:hypothetical protein